ncbi:hypothetical protein BGW41_004486, partial [Actinomortierella wolfii]
VEAIRFEDDEELELFIKHVAQLTSLKKIAVGSCWDGVWPKLQLFIKAYSASHGEGTRHLTIKIGQGPELSTMVVETMALFSPPSPPRAITSYNLSQCVAHLDQVDFSRVQDVFVDHSSYAEHVDLWPQLLRRCSNLRQLEMRRVRSEKRIFQWAVQDRRANRPLAPLKAVKLKFCNFIMYPTVNDLLEGFGSTLETVTIKSGWDGNLLATPFDTPLPRIASGLYLPKLRTLEARVFRPYIFAFDPDHMPLMPQLEVLKLDHAAIQHLGDYLGANAHYDENIDTASPLPTWPLCEFPQLRVLYLTGRPAAEFNPLCFQSMPRLEELTLVLDTRSWSNCWPVTPWTWDWELPSLKTIALGQLMASTFRFRALCYMPNIESVILGGIEDKYANYEDLFDLPTDINGDSSSEGDCGVKGDNDIYIPSPEQGCSAANTNGNSSGIGGGVLNDCVTSIEIGCDELAIELPIWRKLLSPKSFPRLQGLYIGGYIGVHDAAIIQEGSRHPELRELWIAKAEHQQFDWPADEIDEAWECGNGGRGENDDNLLFYVNHKCYHIPKNVK